MSGQLHNPNVCLTLQEDTARVTRMWELEAQNAAREKKREAMTRKIEGSRGKTEDAHEKSREDCMCRCCTKSEKARERCACIFLQAKRGVATSEIGSANHVKSTSHAVESYSWKDSIMAEESSRGIGDEEKRRRVRTGGDAKPGRGYGLESSLNVGIWAWWAQTNRKVHSVERINGRAHWVVKRGDRSKGQKSKVKDGNDNMG